MVESILIAFEDFTSLDLAIKEASPRYGTKAYKHIADFLNASWEVTNSREVCFESKRLG